jgi:hypothetical protein
MDNSGPAFPFNYIESPGFYNNDPEMMTHTGMSLRDWFAGQALSKIASEHFPNASAQKAYELADAMIKERERGV